VVSFGTKKEQVGEAGLLLKKGGGTTAVLGFF
jgi:hypothetical protein